jgi:hypothetical protein
MGKNKLSNPKIKIISKKVNPRLISNIFQNIKLGAKNERMVKVIIKNAIEPMSVFWLQGIFFFPKNFPMIAAIASEKARIKIPTINGIIFSGNHIQDIIPSESGVIHIPIVILFIEKIFLKSGEYFPAQIPKNKIIAAIIISDFVIKIGVSEKITPIIM